MTKEQIDAIRTRLDAATPGPWDMWFGDPTWISVQTDGKTVAECRTHLNHQFSDGQNVWNARLITHAPTDLRALLDEVERLRVERDDLLAWSQRFSDLVGVDGSTEAGRDDAFAKLYDAVKASGKLVKE